jgi:hypothetical protein
MSDPIGFDHKQLPLELLAAETELHAWVTGQRSFTNEQMSVENYVGDSSEHGPGIGPDRGETLVRIAQRDLAETELAIARVKALRLLSGLTEEGRVPA